MKKLVFMFVAAATMSFAVSFSSCGGANTVADSTADSDSVVVVDTTAVDTAAADSVVADSAATDSVKA